MARGARTGGGSRTPGNGVGDAAGAGSVGRRTGGGAVGPSQTGGAPDHHTGPLPTCGVEAGGAGGAAGDEGTGVVSVVSLAIVVCTRLAGCTGGRHRR